MNNRQLGEVYVMLGEAIKLAEALHGDFAAFEAVIKARGEAG